MIFNSHDLKMENKGVIVERVLDSDVPEDKNWVTKECFEIFKR